MIANKAEALEYARERDVKFIRMQFCDPFGTLKNTSIMPSQLELAFDEGIAFDASAVKGFLNEGENELYLVPDATTMCVLPWRPQQGRVIRFFCDIREKDGKPFERDTRGILKKAILAARQKEIQVNVGTECKFYLFETDESGKPVLKPGDRAGYFDVAPLDKGENIRREICLTLEEMGLKVESSHHDSGNGQHVIVFSSADALSAADNLVTFKSVVKAIAGLNGLYASFMPKPINGMNGSGLHIELSPALRGKAMLSGDLDKTGGAFLAGILAHSRSVAAFANPLVNSYKRLATDVAGNVAWSYHKRGQVLRLSPEKYGTAQFCFPDASCNAYLVLALLIGAGAEGVEKGLPLPKENEVLGALPENLKEALDCSANDELVRGTVGEGLLRSYAAEKYSEWKSYASTVDSWEIQSYLGTI